VTIGVNLPSKIGAPSSLGRYCEDGDSDPSAFLNDLADAIKSSGEVFAYPYVVFGHSADVSIMKGLLDKLHNLPSVPPPICVFISAVASPTFVEDDLDESIYTDDNKLIEAMTEWNYSVPHDSDSLSTKVLGCMRWDLRWQQTISRTSSYNSTPLPECNVTIMGGKDDRAVPPHSLDGWKELSGTPPPPMSPSTTEVTSSTTKRQSPQSPLPLTIP